MFTEKVCIDMIDQINQGIDMNIFTEEDHIQVLRDDTPLYDDYYPIIFCYPEDKIVKEMYQNDDFLSMYLEDLDKLEIISVEQAKFELEEILNLLKS